MRAAMICLLVACGTDRVPFVPLVDAPPVPDAGPDASLPAGCDWVELSDSTNDFTVVGGAAEPTGQTLAESITVCGRLDKNHFDGAALTVDVDAFAIELAARTPVLVTYAGAGSDALDSVDIEVLDGTGAVVDGGRLLGSHAAFATTLSAGTYQLVMIAKNSADIATAIDYHLRIAVDDPAARCAPAAAASYAEATDGAQSDGNDVVEVRFAPSERALTAAADAPEPTGLVTAAGTDLAITGTSADVDGADDYRDRDTYLITTGDHDELALRVDWTGDADLDVFVFPEDELGEIGRATTVSKLDPELATFPVLPNTRYWLWIGSYDTSAGLPVDYTATLCPTTFTP